ncbi:hypothetical protein LguiA_025512 [Lonicera macranthoides]
MKRIRSSGQTKLANGIFKLSQWVPDFVPSKQKQSNAHVWVRIHELSWEYLDEAVVLYIAGAVGNPLHVDPHTKTKALGHFFPTLDQDQQRSFEEANKHNSDDNGGVAGCNLAEADFSYAEPTLTLKAHDCHPVTHKPLSYNASPKTSNANSLPLHQPNIHILLIVRTLWCLSQMIASPQS